MVTRAQPVLHARPVARRVIQDLPSNPSLILRFAGVNALEDAKWFGPVPTFTRASTATYFDANGVLQTAASGEARFDYDPATGDALGLLIEEQRTNSLLDNRDLSTGNWAAGADISIAQNATGLDGVANKAWTITDDTGSGQSIEQRVTVSDDLNTHTVIWTVGKDSNTSRFILLFTQLIGGTSVSQGVRLNTSDGSFSNRNGSASNVTVFDYGDFWRVAQTITNNGTGNNKLDWKVYPGWSDTLDSDGANVIGSIVVDFPQVELNASFATSPIETAGSAVTRNADVCETTDVGWYNEPQGTFIVEYSIPAVPDSGTPPVFSIDNGGSTNRVQIFTNANASPAQIRYRIDRDGDASVAENIENLDLGETEKVAISIQRDNHAIVANGGSVFSETGNVPVGLTTFRVGSRNSGTFMSGHIKSITYYASRLPDAELVRLTS